MTLPGQPCVAPVRAPADPFAIARALCGRPGLALLASTDAARRTQPAGDRAASYARASYVACEPDELVTTLDPLAGQRARATPGQPGVLSSAPSFIGTLPYEAFRGLERPSWAPAERRPEPLLASIEWLRYRAVVAIDHRTGEVLAVGDDDAAARSLARLVESSLSGAASGFELRCHEPEPAAAHVSRVRAAIERILEGDFYQVNLARRIAASLSPAEPLAFVAAAEALSRASPTPFSALLRTASRRWVLSSSPELLLDATPSSDGSSFGTLCTEPIKGTRRRSADAAEDTALALELARDPKEIAELAMIVDVERNDLHRVCAVGTVRVDGAPHVVSHSTVHHRVARVTGEVRPDVSRAQVLAALLPSGSVTGAPKVRAMEVIAELEPVRRGLYTGGLGFFGRDGSLRLSMAIRTLVFDEQGVGEYVVGGGIVADSDPQRELDETRWKAAQLEAMMGARKAPA